MSKYILAAKNFMFSCITSINTVCVCVCELLVSITNEIQDLSKEETKWDYS